MKKKKLKKIISGLLVLLTAIAVIGCEKPITKTEALVETSEETTLTEEESVSTQTETETSEEPIEEETIEEETTEEETTEEETPTPIERYFTYEVKYLEVYSNDQTTVKIITDKSIPGNFRVTLTKDLPPSFFERAGCPDAQTCLLEVIQETLGSIEGNKRLVLRDTQQGLPKFGEIDTSKPVELIFLAVRDEEYGKICLPPLVGTSIPLLSFTFVKRLDGGLRVLIYEPDWESSTKPGWQYVTPTASLFNIACILVNHELLGVGQLPVTNLEEEKLPPFWEKVFQLENSLPPIGILRVDFD